jgi:hypothetical protein
MLAIVTQLGAAGLMGAMWLTERRAASLRETQLSGAHDRIMLQQKHLDVLVRALEDNTRALISLESNQRELAGVLTRLEARVAATHGAASGIEVARDGGEVGAPAKAVPEARARVRARAKRAAEGATSGR